MQLSVGNILEGKVTGITKFGAFVELPEGKTGMVHISEVASTYVKEISEHIKENQIVKVKVLSISDDGKVSLSIKKAQDNPPPAQHRRPAQRAVTHDWSKGKSFGGDTMTFEDMMSKFKQTSEDKMSDLKKYRDVKKGSSNRKSQPK